MTQAGELSATDGYYELAGPLLARYERQKQSRTPRTQTWTGDWILLVVRASRREAGERSDMRAAARLLHYGELREGVWIRPDNLAPNRNPEAWSVVTSQCRTLLTQPDNPDELVSELWDLPAWEATARQIRADMGPLVPSLIAGDHTALTPAFLVAAAAVRHILADPLLPEQFCADSSSRALREGYNEFEATFQTAWREFFTSVR